MPFLMTAAIFVALVLAVAAAGMKLYVRPKEAMERVVGGTRDRPAFRDDVSQRLQRGFGPQALVQFGHVARRAGHRHLRVCRRSCRQHVWRRRGPAAHDPARRRSRDLRPGARWSTTHRQPRAAMAAARRSADGDAAGPTDPMEGRSRFHRSHRRAGPPRHLLPVGRHGAAARLSARWT